MKIPVTSIQYNNLFDSTFYVYMSYCFAVVRVLCSCACHRLQRNYSSGMCLHDQT